MGIRKWIGGNPPHIGFWMTGFEDEPDRTAQWRWWDGLQYSFAIPQDSSPDHVNVWAGKYTVFTSTRFVYSNHWPKNARVKRINPEA